MTNIDTSAMRRHGALTHAERLAGLGVELPADTSDALDRHARLVARKAAIPKNLRQTVAATLAADPGSDVSTDLAHLAAIDLERRAVADASQAVLAELKASLTHHADDLVADLRTAVFDPAVAILTTAASVHGTTMQELVIAKRNDEAQAVAQVPVAVAQVRAAVAVRNALFAGAGLTNSRFQLWANPDVFRGVDLDPDDLVARLVAGGQLWLGTYSEIDQAERAEIAARKGKAQALLGHPNRPTPKASTASAA